MSLRLCFVLFTGLLVPNAISTQSDNNLKFTVISTTEPSQHQNEYNLIKEQLQICTTLIKTKSRLETLDLKINQIQKTLGELVKLHDVKSQETPTISKMEKIIEEKLKLYKGTSCDNVSHSKDIKNQIMEIEKKQAKQLQICDTKLQDVKQQVVEEIEKRNGERAELYEVNIQKAKKDIVAAFSTEIGTKLQEAKYQVIEEIEKRNRVWAELYEVNIQKAKKDVIAAFSTEIGTKLQEVKQQVVEEIENINRGSAELFEVNVQKVKKEVVTSVSTEIGSLKEEIKLFDVKLNASINQLKETKKQIDEEFENILEKQSQRECNRSQAIKPQTRETPTNIPKNCKEVQEKGNNVSGVYSIQPKTAPEAYNVLCNMETRGGGWTYVLNRFDGSQEFYLRWADYKHGFGDLTGEFWLGLEHLYELTGTNDNELLVELADWEGKSVYAHFTNFSIGSEQDRYPLNVLTGYSGDAGNSFAPHVGSPFYTLDRQQGANGRCVIEYHGAWWYINGCLFVKLTGKYIKGQTQSYAEGIHWGGFHGYSYSLKQARMMIRPFK